MEQLEHYKDAVNAHILKRVEVKEPKGLYNPIVYLMKLGGKRLRPVLTLMVADLFGEDYRKALDASLAVELFHNFSLMHDDIMDAAPLRRGEPTVHEKWGTSAGILSGDAMLINAYQIFESYEPTLLKELLQLFGQTAIAVCEGQQYDMDFEERIDVTIPQYLKMIEFKTAVLVAAAMQMGALVAGASVDNQKKVYQFGINLGLAFQLQDDYLDAFGDPKTFGKQVGGDIIENKKTFLYIKALERAKANQKEELQTLYTTTPKDNNAKVLRVKTIFVESGSVEAAKKKIEEYTTSAFEILETIDITADGKQLLRTFGKNLMNRTI